MLKKVISNQGSSFRIKRPLITTSGFVSEVDATIQLHLDELDSLLGKAVLVKGRAKADPAHGYGADEAPSKEGSAEPRRSPGPEKAAAEGIKLSELPDLLALPLAPKQIPSNTWRANSLLNRLSSLPESSAALSLSEVIDTLPELSALKYAFENQLSEDWVTLDAPAKAVLDEHPAIRDYLVASAYLTQGLKEVNGLFNFILKNRLGVRSVANYAQVSAARSIIDADQIKVADYNRDDSAIVARIISAGLPLSSTGFKPALTSLIKDFMFNSDELDLIDKARVGKIPSDLKPLLVKYIQNSPVPVDAHNINNWLPLYTVQAASARGGYAVDDEFEQGEAEKDFEVQFFEDDSAMLQVSRSAVRCAAQLYYSMVMDQELGIFNVVDYFTRKYLLRGGMEIVDRRLRSDLQSYVFSNRFHDGQNHLVDRTRPAEREMFYMQVFNSGRGQVPPDLLKNSEYPQLIRVLILEGARYLQRVQLAPNPDNYVSRQNVSQAVEDLQYNLSVHTVGMVNVIAPLIYAELDFVIRRIFMHPEVIRQIAPQGGTWWKVVENLYLGMKNARPKATVLYNKAKLGYTILRSIADYNPASFEDDQQFSAFISQIDLFITTQSALQKLAREGLDEAPEEADEGEEELPAAPSADYGGNGAQPAAVASGGDEWDF